MFKISKKIISAIIILSLILNNFYFINTYAFNQVQISSEAAIVMNADTKEIIYSKNIHTRFYPASITKIMTALLVLENKSLNSSMTFSQNAINNVQSNSVSIGAKPGDKITIKDALYALLLKSANEVANALAENTFSSIENFAKQMNKKAKKIGASNTNFVNPSGLHDDNHYTTAYDMALITKAAIENTEFLKIQKHNTYNFPTLGNNLPRLIKMGHKMMDKNDEQYYPGIIAGKTGYTSKAKNTLVTVVERNNLKLIAVVLKSPRTHYQDTKIILDYAFNIKSNPNKINNYNNNNNVISFNAPISYSNNKNISLEAPDFSNQSHTNIGLNTWSKDEKGFRYLKADRNFAQNEVLDIGNNTYWFDNNTYMATGWRKDKNSNWYYMNEDGSMLKSKWLSYNNSWYYLDENGVMLKNTTLPEGYILDENGILIN